MNEQKETDSNLESLMDMLANKDGVIRQRAREALVAMGKPAVSFLTHALLNSKLDQVRWEAAKALGGINDTGSIPPLVKALEDSNFDVAWLAADALKNYNKAAWPALLQALIESESDAVALRRGAHHVLAAQKEEGYDDLLLTLLKALESSSAPESSALAAYEILKRMEQMHEHAFAHPQSGVPFRTDMKKS